MKLWEIKLLKFMKNIINSINSIKGKDEIYDISCNVYI